MKKTVAGFLFLILLILGIAPEGVNAAGATYYATPTGSGDACTFDAPCSLQGAIEKAQTGNHVYAQTGTYLADDAGDAQVIYIKGDLWLMGGCTWTTAFNVSCSPKTTPSNIDGENLHRGITIEGETAEVSLYGLTIRDGNAHGVNLSLCPLKGGTSALGCGGGIFASGISSLTLGDMTFESNTASSDSTGSGTALGGAVYAFDLNELSIYDSQFTNNSAGTTGIGMGGAIYVEGDSVLTTGGISGSAFTRNDVPDSTYSKGGAILVYNTGHYEIYRNSFIDNNNFEYKIDGAAVYFLEMSSSTFYFAENHLVGNYGRTILHSYTTPSRGSINTIERNIFKDNTAESLIHLEGRDNHTIRNNFITYNSLLRDSRANYKNIYLKGINPDHLLVTIYYNSIAGGVDAISIDDYVVTYIKNNIIASSQGGIYNFGSSVTATIDSNLFFDNDSNGSVGTNPFYGDPRFVNPAAGDLHILKGSAAIDRVSDGLGISDDVDTLSIRPFGGGATSYDIGADEWDLVNEVFLPLMFR